MFCPEHPKWDQNPKFTPLRETTSIPALSNGSPPRQPAQITAIKFLSPTKQLVSQVIVALVVEQGALIIAAVFLLCQLCRYVLLNATQAVMNYAPCTVVKFLHFPYLFVQAIAKTACDSLCPSHCCSQQLTQATVPMQLTCNPVCQSH